MDPSKKPERALREQKMNVILNAIESRKDGIKNRHENHRTGGRAELAGAG